MQRLRIFAGPNGSGKSTIVNAVKNDQSSGRPINLGIYINADDIAKELISAQFTFSSYSIKYSEEELIDFSVSSGLINEEFPIKSFLDSFQINGDKIKLITLDFSVQTAQIFARFLREKILEKRATFSLETVFSHESNIEFIKKAVAAGYKVYLYFVATESPLINKYRVDLRVKQAGHPVPEDKIRGRYYKSLDLLYSAAQLCYQAYFFDNSKDDQPFHLAAHFKLENEAKNWDLPDLDLMPEWFFKYYIEKMEVKK